VKAVAVAAPVIVGVAAAVSVMEKSSTPKPWALVDPPLPV
jgi:hypothetical protein